jgi:hypothetical protein
MCGFCPTLAFVAPRRFSGETVQREGETQYRKKISQKIGFARARLERILLARVFRRKTCALSAQKK